MPIIFRISLDHRFEGGRIIEDSMKLIKLLEEEGMDTVKARYHIKTIVVGDSKTLGRIGDAAVREGFFAAISL